MTTSVSRTRRTRRYQRADVMISSSRLVCLLLEFIDVLIYRCQPRRLFSSIGLDRPSANRISPRFLSVRQPDLSPSVRQPVPQGNQARTMDSDVGKIVCSFQFSFVSSISHDHKDASTFRVYHLTLYGTAGTNHAIRWAGVEKKSALYNKIIWCNK